MTPTESAARHWSEALTRLGACSDAVLWACTQPTYEEAWQTCTRLDWLLWLVARTMGERSRMPMVLAACDIAESVLHLVPAGEERPRKAIEVTRAWCAGQATAEEVTAVSGAASAAARTAQDKRSCDLIRARCERPVLPCDGGAT